MNVRIKFVWAVVVVGLAMGALRAEPAARPAGPSVGAAYTVPEVGLELLPVAAGFYTMGCPQGPEDERPATRVSISRPFWLGKYEVTRGEWRETMGAIRGRAKPERLPVSWVSYDDAVEFCQKLTARERAAGRVPAGYAYRLPTEAEWEYAAKAGAMFTSGQSEYNWPVEPKQDNPEIQVVGYSPANGWGFCEMGCNVWEWCLDGYGRYPGGEAGDPLRVGAPPENERVFRGGNWSVDGQGEGRPTERARAGPSCHYERVGLRVALGVETAAMKAAAALPKYEVVPQEALREGQVLPSFAVRGLEGELIDLASYRGKVVLVTFWTSWMDPDLPSLVAAYREYHDRGFEVIGINLDDYRPYMERAIRESGATWPQYFEGRFAGNSLGVRYRITWGGGSFLLDREGRIVAKNVRPVKLAAFELSGLVK